jgi:hypothetical protein
LPQETIYQKACFVRSQIEEAFYANHNNNQTDVETYAMVDELADTLSKQHCDHEPHIIVAIKSLATTQFVCHLANIGVLASQPAEAQGGHKWQLLPMVLALLAGALLANLLLHYPPLPLIKMTMYKFAEWLWRSIHYLLDCVTGPTDVPKDASENDRPLSATERFLQGESLGTVRYLSQADDGELTDPAEPLPATARLRRKYKDENGNYTFKAPRFPQVVGQLESSSDDEMRRLVPSSSNASPFENTARENASSDIEEDNVPQLAPITDPGEPMVTWNTYGLTVPLSVYNESPQIRAHLHDKVQQVQSQKMDNNLCVFSKRMRCHTCAEAYEDQMFRNWYLQRFYGPMHDSLSPGQMHFAQYCAAGLKRPRW